VIATRSAIEMPSAIAMQNATAKLTPDHAQQVSIKPLTMMEDPSASATKEALSRESQRDSS